MAPNPYHPVFFTFKAALRTILGLFMVFCGQVAHTQTPVFPIKEVSMGNHQHTSRDVLIQMAMSIDSNLLLLGYTESDSQFADVVVQKVSRAGHLIWDYRFDSPGKNDYDQAVKMMQDGNGHIYVLVNAFGLASFQNLQESQGYLFKLNSDGHLLWQTAYDTLLPFHTAEWFHDGFFDERGNLNVTYSCYQPFEARPSFFLKFDPESGILLDSFSKFNILQAYGGGPAALSEALDSTGQFVFLHFDETQSPHHSIRKVDPVSGQEHFSHLNLSGLSSTEKFNYNYLDWKRIWVDKAGAVYSISNVEDVASGAILVKVLPDGKVAYVLRPDSIFLYFNDLIIQNEQVYLIGSYTPKGQNQTVAFLWKLNAQGKAQAVVEQKSVQGCLPRLVYGDAGGVYWAVQNLDDNRVKLRYLNPTNLNQIWTYSLTNDTAFAYTGVVVVPFKPTECAIGGSLQSKKNPYSYYISELDFDLQNFNPVLSTETGHYRFNGTGTTHTDWVGFDIDPFGNYWVVTAEKYGTEDPSSLPALVEYYYHKFDPDLNLLWTRKGKGESIGKFYFDGLGNAYIGERATLDTTYLVKLNPDGAYMHSYALVKESFYRLYIDQKGHVHLGKIKENNAFYLCLLNENLELLADSLAEGYVIAVFQVPNNASVYYYVEASTADSKSIVLFRDGMPAWTQVFDFNHPNEDFTLFDLNTVNGDLMGLAYAYNKQGILEGSVYRLSLNQAIVSRSIGSSGGVYRLRVMPNGNFFLAYNDRADLYSADLQMITPVPYALGGNNVDYFSVDSVFYRIGDGVLQVFGQNGTSLYFISHHSFSFTPSSVHIENDHRISTVSTFGGFLGTNNALGYNWSRSRISLFDQSCCLPSAVSEPQVLTGAARLHVQPNPVFSRLWVDVSAFQDRHFILKLMANTGALVWQKSIAASQNALLELDLEAVPAGIYYLQLISEHESGVQKIVIAH